MNHEDIMNELLQFALECKNEVIHQGVDMSLIENQDDLNRLNSEGLTPDGTKVISENDIGKYGFVKVFNSDYQDAKDHIDNYAYNDISDPVEIKAVSFPILKFGNN